MAAFFVSQVFVFSQDIHRLTAASDASKFLQNEAQTARKIVELNAPPLTD